MTVDLTRETETSGETDRRLSRRRLLGGVLRGLGLAGVGAVTASAMLGKEASASMTLWQIDPDKCTQCGDCATACVLTPSAVKCVHTYAMCGYCKICTGFFEAQPSARNTAAENQLCPLGAIRRTYVEDPYYEYKIDEELCVGCGKCVAGCGQYGNGSLYLQILHDRCRHCNECAIARACPAEAIRRVDMGAPYLLKALKKTPTPTPAKPADGGDA